MSVPNAGTTAGPCPRRERAGTGAPLFVRLLVPLLAPLLVPLLVLVLAALVTPLAATPAQTAAPPPAAASSLEPGELHQDAPEATLRRPTGHPTRRPADRRPRPYVPASLATGPAEHLTPPSHRALRTVVLRC
ncbi:hypothetical protein [Streptomyces sp. NPDC016845]|uniref:hypothetical protein n=1 Tax=Streptomyces sp. NPDC016845 TaxID=3364972 RepID=UPI0037899F8E